MKMLWWILSYIIVSSFSLGSCTLDSMETADVVREAVIPTTADTITLSSSSDSYLFGAVDGDTDVLMICVYNLGESRYDIYDTSEGLSSASYSGIGISGSSDGEYIYGMDTGVTANCYYPGELTYETIEEVPWDWEGWLWFEMNGGPDIIYLPDRPNGKIDMVLYGGAGNDYLYGTNRIDWIFGGSGEDTIYGYSGNDFIYGNEDDDPVLDGGPGVDYIVAGSGDDTVYGGSGADIIYGYPGSDTINGGSENDRIYGGSENDTINGGTGSDIIDGQAGTDTCTNGPTFYNCELP